ncbi:hypothetical protein CJ195_11160 [Bacillus sp. UMB0899]|nr:hypothetical protein CJ195_11160 [Bacillus sp. UMB0899]
MKDVNYWDWLKYTQITDSSDIIAYVFGLIACVFTLVGLLSIFISINSQHNIQKCREILWELKVEESPEKLIKNIELYQDIIEDKSEFTSRVISISVISIWCAIIIVAALNFVLIKEFLLRESLFIAAVSVPMVIVLYAFSRLLLKLKNITEISNLPTLEKLLDVNDTKHGVNALRLASKLMNMHFILYSDESDNPEVKVPKFGFAINLPFRFRNLFVTAPTTIDLTSYNENDQLNIDICTMLNSNIAYKHSGPSSKQNKYFLEVPLESFMEIMAAIPGYYESNYWYILDFPVTSSKECEESVFHINEYDIYQMRKIASGYDSYINIRKDFISEITLAEYTFTLLDPLREKEIFLGLGNEKEVDTNDKSSTFKSTLHFNPVPSNKNNIEILGHIPIPSFNIGESFVPYNKSMK